MALMTAALLLAADIFMMGDSTMCDYKSNHYPQEGWGQRLRTFVKDGVNVHNLAIGGRSTKTFIGGGTFQKALDDAKVGDYAIIAFGHNDASKAKREPPRYCTPDEFKANLVFMVEKLEAKGVKPVLATSIIHAGGVTTDANGKTQVRAGAAGIGPYCEKTRELAKERGLPILDLNEYARIGFGKMSEAEVLTHYMKLGPGISGYHPEGHGDKCHVRDKGADFYARGAVKIARKMGYEIAKDCFKDPDSVPFVPSVQPEWCRKAYEKVLAKKSSGEEAPATFRQFDWSDDSLGIGNYDVSIPLGNPKCATTNFIKFAGRRLAADRIVTKPGETVNYTFTARVPGPYTTRKGRGRENLGLGIAVFTCGVNDETHVLEPQVVPAPDAHTIYLCGDSTVTDQQKEPWGSWGQILPAFTKRGWAVSNFARSGLALKTFEGEGRLKRIFEHLRKGDWVVIQFGHNDQKIAGEEPENGYTRRLNDWIDRIRAKGASAVLVTPVERRRFDEKTGEHQGKTLAGYADAVKAVAAAKNVPLIDLNEASYRMHAKMGVNGSKAIQCNNRGKIDNTHHNIYGAYEMARIVAAGLAKIPVVGEAVREKYREFNPEKPDADPKIPPSGKTDWTKPAGS